MILLISCDPPSKIKEVIEPPSLFNILPDADSVLTKMIISTDIQLLMNNKALEGKFFQPAKVIIKNNQSVLYDGALRVRPRGITRRSICSFPPLMIKSRNKELLKQNIGSSSNIKLVTHCEDSIQYDQWVNKEYLAYKMLNILTENSFKVKKLEVTYEDSKNIFTPITKRGFLIEPLDELSNRLSCPIVDEKQPFKNIHKEQYKLITLFQFMIGNTDWNLSRRHNIRLLNCTPDYGPTPLPYDFDYSGFVNTSYAVPHALLPIENVQERLLQWRGGVDEDFTDTVLLFNKNKNSFISLIENATELTQKEKDASIVYLEEFYKIISTQASIKKHIIKARAK